MQAKTVLDAHGNVLAAGVTPEKRGQGCLWWVQPVPGSFKEPITGHS